MVWKTWCWWFVGNFQNYKLVYRPSCHTLTNVFSISRRDTAVLWCKFRLLVISSKTLMSCIMVLCCGLKPYCSERSFAWCKRLVDLVEIFQTFFIVFRSEIGRWLIGSFRSLLDFGNMTISASFQHLGKYSSLVQALNISQMKVFVFLSLCLRFCWDL